MDAEIRDFEKVLIDGKKLCFNAVFAFDHDASRQRKRAVHPGGIDRSAIRLDIQRSEVLIDNHRIWFEFEGRGIVMGGADFEIRTG